MVEKLKLFMKKVIWIGSSYDDFMEFPSEVRNASGYALYQAQLGKNNDYQKIEKKTSWKDKISSRVREYF